MRRFKNRTSPLPEAACLCEVAKPKLTVSDLVEGFYRSFVACSVLLRGPLLIVLECVDGSVEFTDLSKEHAQRVAMGLRIDIVGR